MHVAFSRAPDRKKQYVQDQLHLQRVALRQLILSNDAHVFVCGNARSMAKDVYHSMVRLLAEDAYFVGCQDRAAEYLKDMEIDRRWQEDVW